MKFLKQKIQTMVSEPYTSKKEFKFIFYASSEEMNKFTNFLSENDKVSGNKDSCYKNHWKTEKKNNKN